VQLLSDVQGGGQQILWHELMVNDWGRPAQSSASFATQLVTLFDSLHASLPNLKIYLQTATTLVAPSSEADTGNGTLGAYRTAAAAVVTARSGWSTPPSTVDGTSFVTLVSGTDYYTDGLHPNASGHAKIEAAVKTTIGW